MSDSLIPHGPQAPDPWDSLGKNMGVGSISFSRGFSRPRDQTQVSRIAGRLYHLSHQGSLLRLIRQGHLFPPFLLKVWRLWPEKNNTRKINKKHNDQKWMKTTVPIIYDMILYEELKRTLKIPSRAKWVRVGERLQERYTVFLVVVVV